MSAASDLRTLAVAGALLAAAGSAGADETTSCHAFITALPYTITAQGHYCFDRNLSTSITTGAAITIDSDYVLLDMNHFKLGGGAAGPATQATGIHSAGRSNVTIRNGNVRGFRDGIRIESPAATAGNVTIENNTLDGHTGTAVYLDADSFRVRGNRVSNCTTGIDAYTLTGARRGELADNFISDVANFGIDSGPAVVEGNRLVGVRGEGGFALVGAVCRDNVSLDGGQVICAHRLGTDVDVP